MSLSTRTVIPVLPWANAPRGNPDSAASAAMPVRTPRRSYCVIGITIRWAKVSH